MGLAVAGGLVALMSVVDMALVRPWDGVVPDPYSAPGILVQDLVPGGGADKAGLRPGDVVLGIGHRMLARPVDAPAELRRHAVGEQVLYLVQRGDQVFEVTVALSAYRAASFSYFYFAILGFGFLALGAFVLAMRPNDPATGVFFLLCTLFLLFFVCRLRPLSYYWVDYFVQLAGTFALFLLPAVFLHFFLLFPSRKQLHFADGAAAGKRLLEELQKFLNGSPLFFVLLYTLPPATYVVQMASYARAGRPERLIYGAPLLNWILLADYLVLGLLALFHSWWTAPERQQRQQILVLLVGTLAGTLPFVGIVFWAPWLFHSDRFLLWGIVPMALVPISFAYAIVRFRLFEVHVIVRKSIVYGLVTAAVTGFYALVVVTGSRLASSAVFFSSPLFAFSFALVVVLIVDPLRRRLQEFVDRRFFRDRADFQRALVEMSRSVVSQLEREKLHELLTAKTAELFRVERLDLLTPRPEDGALSGAPYGSEIPLLPVGSRLGRLLLERGEPVRLAEIEPVLLDAASERFRDLARAHGVRVLVPVATRGRLLGLMAVGSKRSEEEFGPEDLDHLATIANQGALGLEASALHEELTRRAEVQRDLEIARDIQISLFPRELPRVPGLDFFGLSRPAKEVGGDFYDFLPFPADGKLGLVVGDVSGKSIPASLLMVAAKEIVYARAMTDPDPATVFRESNRRIYAIKRRMFVALSYFVIDPEALSLHYTVGGQPPPLLVRAGSSEALEIPTPSVHLPLGALRDTDYDAATLFLRRGDLLLFFTDGLNEAMSVEQCPYGHERLKASLVRHASRPLPELADEILEDIRQFTFGAEQYDDQTFVLMRVASGKPGTGGGVIEAGRVSA